MSRPAKEHLALYGLALLWAVAAAFMVANYLRYPYDPSLLGTKAYGHNHEGALHQGLIASLAELGVLYALLRPWSYEKSWGRSVCALLVFLPWLAMSLMATMHAGGVFAIHLVWVFGVVLACGGSGVYAALRR